MPERRLLREVGNIRTLLAMAVGFGTLVGCAVIAQAQVLARLINGAFLDHKPLAALTALLILFAAVLLGRVVVAWAADAAAALLSYRARGRLRSRLIARLFALGPSFARGKRSGVLVNVLGDGVESLDSYVAGYLPQMFLAVTIPLLILVTVFPVDPLSGLVLLLSAPVIPVFMVLIGKLSERMTQQRWSTLNWMSGHFLDVLQGLTILKLFGRDQVQVEKVRAISNRFRIATMQVLRVAFLSSLVMELAGTISTAVVAVEVGIRLLAGGIPFEQALFVLILAPEFYLPLRTLGIRHHAALAARAAAGGIAPILDAPQTTVSGAEGTPASRTWQTIAFDDVSFTYSSSGEGSDNSSNAEERQRRRVALENCSFTIRRGEHIALIGPSGAGKSTVAHLLLRFIEPTAGAIHLDGVALASIAADTWREQMTWVPQLPYLFNATVAENILLARPGATRDAVVAAAQAAQAHEFIAALPQGYETVLGERGVRLSGGQAQRIALARAFLRDAPILIVDEPTSHLDPSNEASLHAALEQLAAGRTLIMITHHLAALNLVDRVLVMRRGRVVEDGTPSALQLAVAANPRK